MALLHRDGKTIVKGKREKDIPWFNDDFGGDFGGDDFGAGDDL